MLDSSEGRTGGQGVRWVRGMQIRRPFKDFAFYSKLKGKPVQGFEGWRDMVSKDMHFCNTWLFCNDEHVLLLSSEKIKISEHLEDYMRISKQVQAVSLNANMWVQRKEWRGREEKKGGRRGCIWLEVQVSPCHCPCILWGLVFFDCSPIRNCTSVECCLAREEGREQRVQQEQKTKHGLNSSLIGIKYIWFTPPLSTLPCLYKVGAKLLLEEMNELTWRFSLNYSAPLSPFSLSFFVGITEF